jgi:hypothetical protein
MHSRNLEKERETLKCLSTSSILRMLKQITSVATETIEQHDYNGGDIRIWK